MPIEDVQCKMTAEQVIQQLCGDDYTFQIHKIHTQDKYILTAWKITNNNFSKEQLNTKNPIVLLNGLMDCSFSWFTLRSNKLSLPFILADQGYQVWTINNRGTMYSIGHETIKDELNSQQYWNFSLDEFVKYDLEANIKYVLNESDQEQIIYIGHSQGSTQALAKFTIDLEFQKYFKVFIGLGPSIYVRNLESPVVKLLFTSWLLEIVDFFKFKYILLLPRDFCYHIQYLILNFPRVTMPLVYKIFTGLCGNTKKVNLPVEDIAFLATKQPGGTSVKNMLQWKQFYQRDTLCMFDYGKQRNMHLYGQETPKNYDLTQLEKLYIPKYFFFGNADYLCAGKDQERFQKLFDSNSTQITLLDDFAHLDYLWGKNAPEHIYQPIVQILERSK